MTTPSICHVKFFLRRLTESDLLGTVRSNSLSDEKTNAAGSDLADDDPNGVLISSKCQLVETDRRVNRRLPRKQALVQRLTATGRTSTAKTVGTIGFKEDEPHTKRLDALREALPGKPARNVLARNLFRLGLAFSEMVTLGKVVKL